MRSTDKRSRWLGFAGALLAAALVVSTSPAGSAERIEGQPRVMSGDQMRFGSQEIQLFGLDAPEIDQYCENEYGRPYRCGLMALDNLTVMIGHSSVVCVPEGTDEKGRTLAVCYVGDMNINSRMVRTGWAVARREQRPDYVQLESLAKRDKAGIWEFIFEDPATWRAENAAD